MRRFCAVTRVKRQGRDFFRDLKCFRMEIKESEDRNSTRSVTTSIYFSKAPFSTTFTNSLSIILLSVLIFLTIFSILSLGSGWYPMIRFS